MVTLKYKCDECSKIFETKFRAMIRLDSGKELCIDCFNETFEAYVELDKFDWRNGKIR